MTFGIVVFPGSNCDQDAFHVASRVLGQPAHFLWHKDRDLRGADVVVLPGGFSYGDYLRCGALARLSPIMEAVAAHARAGGKVLGICNGFQVLVEAGLLPGALLRNAGMTFICEPSELSVENAATPFTRNYVQGQRVRIPIAHGEGNYFIDDEGLSRLEGEGQVVFRYVDNPNGSRNGIAGIVNAGRNVLGMMPHPERAAEALLGSTDGRTLFESLLS
jgi:phosphoribosylformylglycinamidine synthase